MHYIAIAPSEGYTGVRRKPPPEEPIVVVDQPLDPIEEENQTDALPVKEDVSDISAAEELFLSECPDEKAVEEAENITATAGEKRISTRSEEFLRWYRESLDLKKKARYSFIASKMAPYFSDKEELHRFLHRKHAQSFCEQERLEVYGNMGARKGHGQAAFSRNHAYPGRHDVREACKEKGIRRKEKADGRAYREYVF